MKNIKIFDTVNNMEDKSEVERYNQARNIIQQGFLSNCPLKPGAFIERRRKSFNRLSELEARHFNHSFIRVKKSL